MFYALPNATRASHTAMRRCGEPAVIDRQGQAAPTMSTMEDPAIDYRLAQHALISEFGLYALRQRRFESLMQRASQLAADGLRSQMAKVLSYQPAENTLLVSAGVGWHDGVVGHATIDAGLGSPAGYALHTGKPVLANRLQEEARFRTPDLLLEHGVDRAINVIIQGEGEPFGVLEADAPGGERFDEDDTAFLQSLANVLASAYERSQTERALECAVEEKDALLREKETLLDELNHRVKNNLQVVSNLLSLETARLDDPRAQHRLRAVRNRVTALGRLHQHLYQSGQSRTIEFGGYLEDLCANLHVFYSAEEAPIRIEADIEPVYADLDRATPLALIVNELIANSTQHAFPSGEPGTVRVTLRRDAGYLTLEVSDNGNGHVASDGPGQGRELITALGRQIEADVQTETDHGMRVIVTVSERMLQAGDESAC